MVRSLLALLLFATPAYADGQGWELRGAAWVGECGDGDINIGETCDTNGANTAGCDSDCTAVACGDGIINAAAGEQCESGSCCDMDTCTYRLSNYVCRAYEDNCDPAEYCTGSGIDCPSDTDNCLDNCGSCVGGGAGSGGSCVNQTVTLDTDGELTDASTSGGTCDGNSSTLSWGNSTYVQDDDNVEAIATGNTSAYTSYAGVQLAAISMAASCDIKSVTVTAGVKKSGGGDAGVRAWVIDDGAISDSTYVARDSSDSNVTTSEAPHSATFNTTLPATSVFTSGNARVGLCMQVHADGANQTLRVDYVKAAVTYGPP